MVTNLITLEIRFLLECCLEESHKKILKQCVSAGQNTIILRVPRDPQNIIFPLVVYPIRLLLRFHAYNCTSVCHLISVLVIFLNFYYICSETYCNIITC